MQHIKTEMEQQSRLLYLPVAAGVVTFGTTCAASCASQLVCGISTGTLPPIPTAVGVCTVAMASLASHWAASTTFTYQRTGRWPAAVPAVPSWRMLKSAGASILSSSSSVVSALLDPRNNSNYNNHHHNTLYSLFSHPSNSYWQTEDFKQRLRICVLGLVTFKLLGGRFWALAPSSFTAPGSFARVSIPATEAYATASQRHVMDRLGQTFGCHTCGSHRLFTPSSTARFVGDHMPPKAVAEQWNQHWHRRLLRWKTQFKFYPQCVPCSQKQGSLLSAAVRGSSSSHRSLVRVGGRANAYFHGWRPRTWHWTGGILAAATVTTTSSNGSTNHSYLQRLDDWTQCQWRAWQKKR